MPRQPMPSCTITRCTEAATVLVTLDRPRTTATRDTSYSCWTGHLETNYCAEHGTQQVSHSVEHPDWRFYGDTVTLRPLA